MTASGAARSAVGMTDARGMRIAIVASLYNAWITDRLLEGAEAEFRRLGGDPADLMIVRAPGAYELPVGARAACEGRDGVVALGCLIRGETQHDRVIGDAVANGLMQVGIETGVPVAFGVLTVENTAQAEARAMAVPEEYMTRGAAVERGAGKAKVENKGIEAMAAVVQTIAAIRELRAEGAAGRTGATTTSAARTRRA